MAISYVQINKHADVTGITTTSSVSFSSGTTAGNIILVAGSFGIGATGVTLSNGHGDTVTDSGIGLVTDVSSTLRCYLKAFLRPTTGTTTITATYTGGSAIFDDMIIWEISGLINPKFDKFASATGSNANWASGSTGTLSAAVEAAVAYMATAQALTAANGSGWSTGQGSTVGSNLGDGLVSGTNSFGEHQITASTAAINGNGTLSGGPGQNFTALCATLMSQGIAFIYNSDSSNTFQNGAGSANSYTVTIGGTVQNNSTLIVSFGAAPTGTIPGSALSVTDNKGNIYTAANTSESNTANYLFAVFVATNVNNAPTTITGKIANGAGTSTTFLSITVDTFTVNSSYSATLDVAAMGQSPGAIGSHTYGSGTITPTGTIDLYYGLLLDAGSASNLTSVTSGFTILQNSANTWFSQYLEQSGTPAPSANLITTVAEGAGADTAAGTMRQEGLAIKAIFLLSRTSANLYLKNLSLPQPF